MSEQLEGAVVAALRPRGDGPVDVDALRTRSVRRARSMRRRRVGVVAVGAAVALVGAGQLAAVLNRDDAGGLAVGAPALPVPVPALPAADAPSALDAPASVGSDPALLHFDVDDAALGAVEVSWYSGRGLESASLWNGEINQFDTWYYLASDKAVAVAATSLNQQARDPEQPTTVSGRPGVVQRFPRAFGGDSDVWRLTWQPVDGLWAVVVALGHDASAVLPAAQALRLDRAQRCVAPFSLTTRPDGYTWTGCGIVASVDKPWALSRIELTRADGATFSLGIGNTTASAPFVADRSVSGRPAQVQVEPDGIHVVMVPIRDWVNLLVGPMGVGGDDAELVRLAELVAVGDVFADPSTWPARAVP